MKLRKVEWRGRQPITLYVNGWMAGVVGWKPASGGGPYLAIAHLFGKSQQRFYNAGEAKAWLEQHTLKTLSGMLENEESFAPSAPRSEP